MTNSEGAGRSSLEVALLFGLALMLTGLHALDVELRDDYASLLTAR